MTPREPYYAPRRDFSRLTLAQVAIEIGRTRKQTAKLLRKCGFIGFDEGQPTGRGPTYDAMSIETLKAYMGLPHRKTTSSQSDWLSDYIGGSHHG